MRNLIFALLSALGLAAVLTIAQQCGRAAHAQDLPDLPDEEAWEDTCQEEGTCYIPAGGKPVPTSWAGEPWTKMCGTDKWCPSILEGAEDGEVWCAPGQKCHANHQAGAWEVWLIWYPWLETMCGGQPGLWPANTIRTEAYVGEGDRKGVFSMTKSGTKECGLASVDRDAARELDVNACDPLANIWATCYMRNNRLIALRKEVPEIVDYPLEDQWLLAGAGGAVGMAKVVTLLNMSGALARDADGNPRHAHPHDRVIQYMKSLHRKYLRALSVQYTAQSVGLAVALDMHGLTKQQWKNHLQQHADLYVPAGKWYGVFGWRPGRTAFRIARPRGAANVIAPMYPGGSIPWGEPVLPPRPPDLLPYPGDKLHCACGNWPEEEFARPTPVEYVTVMTSLDGTRPIDPSTLGDP